MGEDDIKHDPGSPGFYQMFVHLPNGTSFQNFKTRLKDNHLQLQPSRQLFASTVRLAFARQ